MNEFPFILLDFTLLGKKYIKQYNWITLQYIHLYTAPQKKCLQCQVYVYLILITTKAAILKIESITHSCMLDSQESSMEISYSYG